MLFGKLKKGILSKIGLKRDYSPQFKTTLKQLIHKKSSDYNEIRNIEKPKFEVDGVNPFARLLMAKPNKALSEANNNE